MRRLLLTAVFALPVFAQEPRLASDFEIAQMEKQLASSRDFEAQLSGRLNLGDARATRREGSLARVEYSRALELATKERLSARREAKMTRYAMATSYAALAEAKLGRTADAFALAEEAVRYSSDDPESWNLYASALRILGKPLKAVSAARNAVALAKRPLDLAVYQHALATALIDARQVDEAEKLLLAVVRSLRSEAFRSLRADVERAESFEVHSSARGDVAAYVSLLNRTQLRLASLYETRGDEAPAREQYSRVLDARSDDATALAGLARLSPDNERERRYAEAFEANPFSPSLVREYRAHLRDHADAAIEATTTGGRMRRALAQLSRGDLRAARATLDELLEAFPQNETLRALRREAEGGTPTLPPEDPTSQELRALLGAFEKLAPEQRVALDQAIFTSTVVFPTARSANGQTVFESGTIGAVAFRFAEPTIFTGTFEANAPLRLTYRIAGVTKLGDGDALLLEAVRLER
jgi:tetratricopeptide (TPR) repeat protein